VDEYTRECLAIYVARKITAFEVIEQLADLFLTRGIPEHLRSDNGPEFTANVIRGWLKRVGVKTLYIESFNGKLRDEFLNREIFDSLYEAKVLAERYRWEYNTFRPHSSLDYRPPAPEAILRLQTASA